MQRALILSLAALALFGAGWWAATPRPTATSPAGGEVAQEISLSARTPLGSRVPELAPRGEEKKSLTPVSSEVWQLVRTGNAPARTPELLLAIERWNGGELQPEQLAVFAQILEQGDYEESSYVLSLCEQYEEVAAVTFLVKQLDHTDTDISDRALMACEAVAGRTFASNDDAKKWAKDWQPDPAIAELFRREKSQDIPAEPNKIGPRKHVNEKNPE